MEDYIVEAGAFSVSLEDGSEILLSRDSYHSYLKFQNEQYRAREEQTRNLMKLAEQKQKKVESQWDQVEEMFSRLKVFKPWDDDPTHLNNHSLDNRVIDDFENAKVKTRPRLVTLRRAVAGAVLGFGLLAAVKQVPKFFLSQSHQIRVESPKSTKVILENKKQVLKGNKKYKKTSKNLETTAIKMNDFLSLNDAKLYYTSQEEEPSVKTRYLNCDSYKIRYVSIISKDQKDILDIVKIDPNNQITLHEFEHNYRLLYGNDICFQMNVDGFQGGKLVYKKAGWTSFSNIKKKKSHKILRKVK